MSLLYLGGESVKNSDTSKRSNRYLCQWATPAKR